MSTSNLEGTEVSTNLEDLEQNHKKERKELQGKKNHIFLFEISFNILKPFCGVSVVCSLHQ
jgi:predicted transcriptional regulator